MYGDGGGGGGLAAKPCPTLVTPWTVARQAPPPMGFSRQEYWSGVPLPSLNFRSVCLQIKIYILQMKLYLLLWKLGQNHG